MTVKQTDLIVRLKRSHFPTFGDFLTEKIGEESPLTPYFLKRCDRNNITKAFVITELICVATTTFPIKTYI